MFIWIRCDHDMVKVLLVLKNQQMIDDFHFIKEEHRGKFSTSI